MLDSPAEFCMYVPAVLAFAIYWYYFRRPFNGSPMEVKKFYNYNDKFRFEVYHLKIEPQRHFRLILGGSTEFSRCISRGCLSKKKSLDHYGHNLFNTTLNPKAKLANIGNTQVLTVPLGNIPIYTNKGDRERLKNDHDVSPVNLLPCYNVPYQRHLCLYKLRSCEYQHG